MKHELESRGFVTVHDVLTETQRAQILSLLDPSRLVGAAKHRSGVVFAARHLLTTIGELGSRLKASGVDALASAVLEKPAFPIDAAYFDKQASANWTVPAHQDRVLPVLPAVGHKHRVAKGVPVAEPGPATLNRLLALRIHFDPTDGDAGALFVLPGSHRTGILSPAQIQAVPLQSFVPCVADVGDVIFMRPLLLHRSPPSRSHGQRRVLHVVYATDQPDDDFRWRASSGGVGQPQVVA